MPLTPPPRRYRLHIFDGTYEVLPNRVHVVTLDLSRTGYEGTLGRWLVELTRQALAANEPMDHPRLEVRDAITGDHVLDWTEA